DPGDYPARHMGWSPGELANAVFCFVEVWALDHDTVVVGFQEFVSDGIELRPRRPVVLTRNDTERSVAHLQTLAARKRVALAHGHTFVGLGHSWLSKQLLVTQRTFRRIGIFQLIADLHDADRKGPPSLVIGPLRMP